MNQIARLSRWALPPALFLGLFAAPALAETIEIEAGRDATLIEDPQGAGANGSGPYFFAGRTNQSRESVRRALLYFDVSAIPRGAKVESASLQLWLAPSNTGPVGLRLHRVLADWGEGPSYASGGGGAPSLPGDATWIHRVFDTILWVRPGGQFVPRPSASRTVDGPGPYTWDNPGMLAHDVQLWVAAPARNFGWILVGDETRSQTSQSFASKENPDPSVRPRLTITYRLPPG